MLQIDDTNKIRRLYRSVNNKRMEIIMMKSEAYHLNEAIILDKLFDYISSHGLENITIRDLCRETGLAQGTLYYWFNDKMSLICEAAEHGLKRAANRIFEYAFSNMSNLRAFFDNCLSEIGRQRDELRFIYQMAASPVYGKRIRENGQGLEKMYDKYAKKLAEALRCDHRTLRPAVYLFVSAVLDYVIWDDAEKAQLQLEFIYTYINNNILGAN